MVRDSKIKKFKCNKYYFKLNFINYLYTHEFQKLNSNKINFYLPSRLQIYSAIIIFDWQVKYVIHLFRWYKYLACHAHLRGSRSGASGAWTADIKPSECPWFCYHAGWEAAKCGPRSLLERCSVPPSMLM